MKKLFSALGGVVLAAACHGQLILQDSFSYPDGPIVGAPASPWVINYLPTNQANVISGKLFLTQSEDESVRINFPSSISAGFVYSRLNVNFSSLPIGAGNFFAFFRQSGVDNLRARIWASTNNAAAGKFRLGILTFGGSSPEMIPLDLSLGTTYTLVSRYDVTNVTCTLWINPRDESDVANRADDLTPHPLTQASIGHYGFLQTDSFVLGQGNGMGELTVDDLRVGKTFAEVLPLVKFTSITNLPGGRVQLAGAGQATTNYAILANTNLSSTNWVNIGTVAAGTNGTWTFTDDTAPTFSRRFYRAVSQ